MVNFIKVTAISGQSMLINLDEVVSIKNRDVVDGVGSIIYMTGAYNYIIQQTVEDIAHTINNIYNG